MERGKEWCKEKLREEREGEGNRLQKREMRTGPLIEIFN